MTEAESQHVLWKSFFTHDLKLYMVSWPIMRGNIRVHPGSPHHRVGEFLSPRGKASVQCFLLRVWLHCMSS